VGEGKSSEGLSGKKGKEKKQSFSEGTVPNEKQ
jgi:hypothetical protein